MRPVAWVSEMGVGGARVTDSADDAILALQWDNRLSVPSEART